MNIIDNIRQQVDEIKQNGQEPKFVILNLETWYKIKAIKEFREYIWFGYEQKNVYNSDKIFGIPVALVTGNEGRVVKVVV